MKRFVFLLVVAGALLAPSVALAGGVVLKVQRATQLFAVTQGKSKVALVHTSTASGLRVGERVAFKGRRLHNGTLAGTNVRIVGHARSVRFQGLLLAKTHARFVISAGGAVIAVARHGRSTASTGGGPEPGSEVTVSATVTSTGDLDEDNVTTTAPSAPGGKLEGTLTLGTGTITVSSDEITLVLKVPTGLDLSAFTNGEEVLAVFVQNSDGTLTLSSVSGDENAQQADDNQGDASSGGNTSTGDGDGDNGGQGGGDTGGGDGDGGQGGGDNGGSGGGGDG